MWLFERSQKHELSPPSRREEQSDKPPAAGAIIAISEYTQQVATVACLNYVCDLIHVLGMVWSPLSNGKQALFDKT